MKEGAFRPYEILDELFRDLDREFQVQRDAWQGLNVTGGQQQ